MDDKYEFDLEELPEKGNIENAKTWEQVIDDLIADENEAIHGYDKAIERLVNSTDNEKILKVLNKIKNDEIQHIQDLKEIK